MGNGKWRCLKHFSLSDRDERNEQQIELGRISFALCKSCNLVHLSYTFKQNSALMFNEIALSWAAFSKYPQICNEIRPCTGAVIGMRGLSDSILSPTTSVWCKFESVANERAGREGPNVRALCSPGQSSVSCAT
jgi:hypothetical protein